MTDLEISQAPGLPAWNEGASLRLFAAGLAVLCAGIAGILFSFQDGALAPAIVIPLIPAGVFVLSQSLVPRRPECEFFCLAFSLYILVAAIAQAPNIGGALTFGTTDSVTFYRAATGYLGKITLKPVILVPGRGGLDSTLAPYVYQHVLHFVQWIERAPIVWPFLCTNAFVAALGVALTVALARKVFWGHRAATLATGIFATFCPQNFYYSAELLRDGFVYVIFVSMLFAAGVLVTTKRLSSLLIAALALATLSVLMLFARYQFGVFGAIIAAWVPLIGFIYGRRTRAKAVMAIFFALVSIILIVVLVPFMLSIAKNASMFTTGYAKVAQAGGGLGYTLVVGLPLPLRVFAGTVYQLIFPIPLWAYFTFDRTLPEWLPGINGLWIVLLVPMAFVGLSMLLSRRIPPRFDKRIMCLLAMAFVTMLLLVAVTTLEERHTSSAYSAFFILAAAPITNMQAARPLLRTSYRLWFAAVIAIHVAWIILKSI